VVSAIYILINFALTRLATWLEQRLRQRPGARPAGPGPAGSVRSPAPVGSAQGLEELPARVAPH
jgi:hypothetical protein